MFSVGTMIIGGINSFLKGSATVASELADSYNEQHPNAEDPDADPDSIQEQLDKYKWWIVAAVGGVIILIGVLIYMKRSKG